MIKWRSPWGCCPSWPMPEFEIPPLVQIACSDCLWHLCWCFTLFFQALVWDICFSSHPDLVSEAVAAIPTWCGRWVQLHSCHAWCVTVFGLLFSPSNSSWPWSSFAPCLKPRWSCKLHCRDVNQCQSCHRSITARSGALISFCGLQLVRDGYHIWILYMPYVMILFETLRRTFLFSRCNF